MAGIGNRGAPQLPAGGRYFVDCNETETIDRRGDAPPLHGVARYALDPDGAQRLWALSQTLLAHAVEAS